MTNLFWGEWRDFPDYISDITQRIWEGRQIETLNRLYAPEIPVRTPMGVSAGNQGVIASTIATLSEFPDRRLLAEDVIWSETDGHYLSSHRILSTGTHLADGFFGPATGRRFVIRVIADCAAREGVIDDDWLIRDDGALIRQPGGDPQEFARALTRCAGAWTVAPAPSRLRSTAPAPIRGTAMATTGARGWPIRWRGSWRVIWL